MSFSFNPGQGQQATTATTAPQSNNGVPALVVPTIPNIAIGGGVPVVEKISPFAYKNRSKSKFGVYFQSAIFVVFGVLVLTTIGLFAYQGILKAEILSKNAEIENAQKEFPNLPITDMIRLSNRLKIVNKVIKEHVSVRTAFKILENSVENPIVYTKFDLSQNKTKKGYSLALSAESPSYHAIYQQLEILKTKSYSNFLSPMSVSAIALDKTGIITFKMATNLSLDGILPESLTFGTSTMVASTTNMEVVNSSDIISGVVATSTTATTTDVNGQVIPAPILIGTPQQ